MRFEKEINIYGDEVILKRFLANETSIDIVQGKISTMISESELVELQNSGATMYSKLASAIMDIDALSLNFSDLTTKYNTVSGQYSSLESKVAEYKLSVDGLSFDITQVSENLSKNYSTTTQMNTAINAKVNELSLSVSSRLTSLETWMSEASLKITDSAIVSTVTESSAWNDKANVNQIGTLIQQNSASVKVAWNNISQYLQFENGALSVYDGAVDLSKKKAQYDQNGLTFWRDGYKIGRIGTSQWSQDNSHKALAFLLEPDAKYMSWSVKKTASDPYYTTMFTYCAANSIYEYEGLHFGSDLYTEGYQIYFGSKEHATRVGSTSLGNLDIAMDGDVFFRDASGATIAQLDKYFFALRNGMELIIDMEGGLSVGTGCNVNYYTNINMNGFSVINSSDIRLKKNVSEIKCNPMEMILGLELQTYDRRDINKHVDAGMIAQQVMEIIPGVVQVGDDGLYGIDYIGLIPYIIGAIQYLYEKQTGNTIKRKWKPKEYPEIEIEEAILKSKPKQIQANCNREKTVGNCVEMYS